MKKKFYITTTLPYVNAIPHIGHALEFIQADFIARYRRLRGDEVVFNIGTDEHGLKIYRKAVEQGKDPQSYVDEYAAKFEEFARALGVSFTNFIRTTDPHHKGAAREFWRRCDEGGYIYKKNYQASYCVGCELEKTSSELVDGRCPVHPNLDIEIIEEENYFFRFSAFQEPLLKYYDATPGFVMPESRLKEIRNFVAAGLQDFSISRVKEKMPWGIPVPGDETQVMYVWFDALVNYVSTLGWPEEEARFANFWGTNENPRAMQCAGKDNLRQQSAIWQAMLMACGLPPTRKILIHGFITSGGQKMSKSLGNTVDPADVVARYGAEALRYWVAREASTFEDSDFTWEKFNEKYEAHLANGLGNLASRVTTLGSRLGPITADAIAIDKAVEARIREARTALAGAMEEFEFAKAGNAVWDLVSYADGYVNETKPWEDKAGSRHATINLIVLLDNIAAMLAPFMPETSSRITGCITWTGGTLQVKKTEPLFPKIAA